MSLRSEVARGDFFALSRRFTVDAPYGNRATPFPHCGDAKADGIAKSRLSP